MVPTTAVEPAPTATYGASAGTRCGRDAGSYGPGANSSRRDAGSNAHGAYSPRRDTDSNGRGASN